MPKSKLPEYLRSYRKRAELTQEQMAYILDCDANKVSRLELRRCLPDLETAFAYAVVLSVPLETLFAGIYEKVERETERRARVIANRLSKTPKANLDR